MQMSDLVWMPKPRLKPTQLSLNGNLYLLFHMLTYVCWIQELYLALPFSSDKSFSILTNMDNPMLNDKGVSEPRASVKYDSLPWNTEGI